MFNVIYDPFLTRKTPFLLCSHFRAHPTTLLLKILGGRMHGPSPHLTFLGTVPPVPPRSLPLLLPTSQLRAISRFLSPQAASTLVGLTVTTLRIVDTTNAN